MHLPSSPEPTLASDEPFAGKRHGWRESQH